MIQRSLLRTHLNKLQAVGLFLAFDGASTRTDPFTSGKKYHSYKLVNNAVFIRNENLFFVSAVASCAFQLEHRLWLLCSVCPGGYEIRIIEYGILFYILSIYRATMQYSPILHIVIRMRSSDHAYSDHAYNDHSDSWLKLWLKLVVALVAQECRYMNGWMNILKSH